MRDGPRHPRERPRRDRDRQTILVYPGGSREVNKRRGQPYQLRGGDHMSFARLAIDQTDLEHLLRTNLKDQTTVSLRGNVEVTELAQDGQGRVQVDFTELLADPEPHQDPVDLGPAMASSENSTTAAMSLDSSAAPFCLPRSDTAMTQHNLGPRHRQHHPVPKGTVARPRNRRTT